MPTLNLLLGDIVTLDAKNKGSDGNFYPSATPPVWTLSDHTIAEFFEESPQHNTIKVMPLLVGTATVSVTTDQGTFNWTINVFAPTDPTLVPYSDSAFAGVPRNQAQALTPGTVDLLDTFTGTDTTLLTAHTPDTTPGGMWLSAGTSSEILGNQAANGATATTINSIDITKTVKAQLDFDVTIPTHTGTNKVTIGFDSTVEAVGSNGIELTITAGAVDSLFVSDGTFSATVTGTSFGDTAQVHYTVIYSGGSVAVYKAGVLTIEVLTPTFTPTGTLAKLKLINGNGAGNVKVDNVKLQELPVG